MLAMVVTVTIAKRYLVRAATGCWFVVLENNPMLIQVIIML
jgi:hypothetical protein